MSSKFRFYLTAGSFPLVSKSEQTFLIDRDERSIFYFLGIRKSQFDNMRMMHPESNERDQCNWRCASRNT